MEEIEKDQLIKELDQSLVAIDDRLRAIKRDARDKDQVIEELNQSLKSIDGRLKVIENLARLDKKIRFYILFALVCFNILLSFIHRFLS